RVREHVHGRPAVHVRVVPVRLRRHPFPGQLWETHSPHPREAPGAPPPAAWLPLLREGDEPEPIEQCGTAARGRSSTTWELARRGEQSDEQRILLRWCKLPRVHAFHEAKAHFTPRTIARIDDHDGSRAAEVQPYRVDA